MHGSDAIGGKVAVGTFKFANGADAADGSESGGGLSVARETSSWTDSSWTGSAGLSHRDRDRDGGRRRANAMMPA